MGRGVRAAVAVACAGIAVGSALAACARGEAPPASGALAVVLAQRPDRLVAVDLDAMRVVRQVELRSLASGMDVDPATGLAVTAQCGGLGDRSDDAAGVWDSRAGGAVRYVKLPRPNPRRVFWCGTRAFLDHGWFEEGRLAVSAVDARSSRATGPMWLPDGTGAIGAAGGSVWALGPEPGAERAGGSDQGDSPVGILLGRLDAGTGRYAPTTVLAPGCNAVVDAGDRRGYLVGGGWDARGLLADDPGTWVAAFDSRSGIISQRVEVPGTRQGFYAACVTTRFLVAADWATDEPGSEGLELVVFERAGLRVVRRIRVPAGPCALASWGERVVVLERASGRLTVVDPATGRTEGSVAIGGAFLAPTVRVLPARPDARTP